MIIKLDFNSENILNAVLQIQREAYEVEAILIASRAIPQLHEGPDGLLASKEIFYGYFSDHDLKGFVAIEEGVDHVLISRLVVRPEFFLRGIGSRLVEFILKNKKNMNPVIVSTGFDNSPAKKLYRKFGFIENRLFEAEGIKMLEMRLAL